MDRSDPAREQGFTLIEMLIVTTVLTVLASITVPNLVRSRATASRAAVIGTLRTLADAQFQFKTLELVDANGDSAFEHATLEEMSGHAPLRGTTERLAPALLGASMGGLDAQGRLMRNGYYFAMYLPDAAGLGLAETPANAAAIAPALATSYWTCLAWPVDRNSGYSTFFVNQQGELVRTSTAPYVGANVPPAGAALVSSNAASIAQPRLAVNATGADGNQWVSVQ